MDESKLADVNGGFRSDFVLRDTTLHGTRLLDDKINEYRSPTCNALRNIVEEHFTPRVKSREIDSRTLRARTAKRLQTQQHGGNLRSRLHGKNKASKRRQKILSSEKSREMS